MDENFKAFNDIPRDKFLWRTRTELEGAHRYLIHLYGIEHTYIRSVGDVDHLPEMTVDDFHDTCNKSVPVYIPCYDHSRLLNMVLQNYIYRRSFRPYRSEIEHQRFICKFIVPLELPDETSLSQSSIQSILPLNRAVCAEVEARRCFYEEQRAFGHEPTAKMTGLDAKPELHILQPLFRALVIIVCLQEYHNEDSKTVGRLPVFLALTGVEDGLSAPITFEPIAAKIDGYLGEAQSTVRTTLETAIDFVMDLEAREAAAFGLQPDPWEPYAWTAHRWRTPEGTGPLIGPSSWFVDTEKYPEWSGNGWYGDMFMMAEQERRNFRWDALGC